MNIKLVDLLLVFGVDKHRNFQPFCELLWCLVVISHIFVQHKPDFDDAIQIGSAHHSHLLDSHKHIGNTLGIVAEFGQVEL